MKKQLVERLLGSVGLLIIHMIHSLLVATETSVECQVWTLRRFRAIKSFEMSRDCTIAEREQFRSVKTNVSKQRIKDGKSDRAREKTAAHLVFQMLV